MLTGPLQELLKFTPEDHQDYEDAKAALEKVQSVVEEVNKKKRESENLQKILEIQGRISNLSVLQLIVACGEGNSKLIMAWLYGLQELGQSLVKPGRQYFKEVRCNKISSQGKSQECHLFLFSDILLYTSTTLFQQKISDFKSTIKVPSLCLYFPSVLLQVCDHDRAAPMSPLQEKSTPLSDPYLSSDVPYGPFRIPKVCAPCHLWSTLLG